jgi:hypothetical protein
METALIVYLALGLVLALVLLGSGIISDIKHGPDHKFGYNYKSTVMWSLVALVGIPIVNIGFLGLLIWIWIDSKLDQIRKQPI